MRRSLIILTIGFLLLWQPLALLAAVETLRATAHTTPDGAGSACTDPAFGRDTDLGSFAVCSSFSFQLCTSTPKSDSGEESIRYHTWTTTSESYSTLDLKIKTEVIDNSSTVGDGVITATVTLDYTTNGGTGWNNVFTLFVETGRALTTDTISLSPGQDLSQVEVRIRTVWTTDCTADGTAKIDIDYRFYDGRTEGAIAIAPKLLITKRNFDLTLTAKDVFLLLS